MWRLSLKRGILILPDQLSDVRPLAPGVQIADIAIQPREILLRQEGQLPGVFPQGALVVDRKAPASIRIAFRSKQAGQHRVEFPLPSGVALLRRLAESLMAEIRPAIDAAQEGAHLAQAELQASRAFFPRGLRETRRQAVGKFPVAQAVPGA